MPAVCPKHGLEYNKRGRCLSCLRIYQRQYRLTESGKLAVQKYALSEKRKESKRKHNLTEKAKLTTIKYQVSTERTWRQRARTSVLNAVRRGKLIKKPCQVCGDPKVEAHHYLGYSKEHQLSVVFLCRAHHIIADKELKSNGLIV